MPLLRNLNGHGNHQSQNTNPFYSMYLTLINHYSIKGKQGKGKHDEVQDKTFSKFFNNHIGIWHCSNQGASRTK